MARGHVRNVGSAPGGGSVLLSGQQSARRRRAGLRFGGGSPGGIPSWRLAVVLVIAAVVGGALAWRSRVQAREDRHAAAARFVTAWEHGDRAAMWRALTPGARAKYSEAAFAGFYHRVHRIAGVTSVRPGRIGGEHGG